MTKLMEYTGRVKAGLYVRGRTQKELAARLGIAPETFSRKMRSPGLFTAREIEQIRAFMGWSNLCGEGER